MWLVLRIIIYSRMLGLSLMLMSFYLGQNVLMIVDVLSLLIGILQQVTSFIGFVSDDMSLPQFIDVLALVFQGYGD